MLRGGGGSSQLGCMSFGWRWGGGGRGRGGSVRTGLSKDCGASGSDRRELRRARGFCSESESGIVVPLACSLFFSFDRALLDRPFDARGLLFGRLGTDDIGPGDSVAVVVVGVVAEETGCKGAETRRVGFVAGCALRAGSSSTSSFSLRACLSNARESGIGSGTTST